ncbi:hypothetical protein D051_1521 [Vibrio parahaemolyticus VPCR-2010]|nr:hypothetical protein D051_1521 [Vibrio parahaemolyticus VPCR-2010]
MRESSSMYEWWIVLLGAMEIKAKKVKEQPISLFYFVKIRLRC